MVEKRDKLRLIFIGIYVLCIFLVGSLFMIGIGAIIANAKGMNTAQIVGYILGTTKGTPTADETYVINTAKGYGNVFAYLVVFISAIFLMKEDFKEDFISLKTNVKFYRLYIPIAVVLFTGIAYLLSYLVGLYVPDSENQTVIENIMKTSAMVPMIISTVIFAPVIEELIYRKCVFYYTRNFKIYVRYIISIILFTLPHILTSIGKFTVGQYFLMTVPYILDAFMLALIYHKGKYNVYTSIACHIANNILAVILVFI